MGGCTKHTSPYFKKEKIMKKQILMLLGVATLTYASANLSFVETAATLARPTWHIGYFQNTTSGDFLLARNANSNGSPTGALTNIINSPGYTRTADGIYFNYQAGLGGTGWDNGDFPNTIPNGLTINMTFNRSNTNWVASGTGLYYPFGGGQIGSNNLVGTLTKNFITINNETNKDYMFWLDTSSSGSAHFITIKINTYPIRTGDGVIIFASDYNLSSYYLPAFSTLEFTSRTNNSSAAYLDAWYLQDLGVSASYNAGYTQGETDGYDSGLSDGYDIGFDQGEFVGYEDGYDIGFETGYEDGLNNGLAATPIENIFTAIFSGIANIFNIQIFGNITLGTIIIAPIAVALLWYILGIVSGVGGKK
jgi:hypothetical protein